jgi:menaquinone-9 beta-reductase
MPDAATMDRTEVLIVGGGPAGSTCAQVLRAQGIDVVVLDKARFPRDKVCAGWVTPQVMQTLGVDLEDYRSSRTLQPITAFRTGLIARPAVGTEYREPVSYGIRRSEFDHYLLQRSGARVRSGEALQSLRRADDGGWVVNDAIEARLLVGAGGHFCPVARQLGARIGAGETVIAAQELEYRMSAEQAARCAVEPERPELYFCDDLKGYGWCFRKGDWLNVGLGREDKHRLSAHVEAFCDWLRREARVPADLPDRFKGHAYLLYTQAPRALVADAALLIGDAAGLAYAQSGEGIRPAVESGIFAAQAVAQALAAPDAAARQAALDGYATRVEQRFGRRGSGIPAAAEPSPPSFWRTTAARVLMSTRWFSRHVVINRWFLHGQQPALPAIAAPGRTGA